MSEMSSLEKLKRLAQHWQQHNSSHKKEFISWRQVAMEEEMQPRIVDLLEQAAGNIDQLNNILQLLAAALEEEALEEETKA